jgi:pimeloyl-ACP methyl ester carboxylesterase
VRSLVLVGTALELFPQDDPCKTIIDDQLQLLEQEGPEVAFDRQPEGVETTIQVLWDREEAEARGELDTFLEQQRVLAQKAKWFPKRERIRYYVAELKNIQAYMDVDLRPYAQRISAPTLVLHGSCDRAVPVEWSKELAKAIPSARLHVIEGGPHGLLFRDLEARRIVREFIQSVEAS